MNLNDIETKNINKAAEGKKNSIKCKKCHISGLEGDMALL